MTGRELFRAAMGAVFALVPSAALAQGLEAQALAGPLGGALAAAFAGGAIAGYGFCVRTILKISNGRIASLEGQVKDEKEECRRQIEALTRRQRELEDMLLGRRPLGHFSNTYPPVGDPKIDEQIRNL
jgi:hypothetical protein